MSIIDQINKGSIQHRNFDFNIGDTVNVFSKIIEGTKERVQRFTGVVIAKFGGGVTESFTVRRIVAGKGVEKTFLHNSPRLVDVAVTRLGKVRRAKLYYLRDRTGRATRPEELILSKDEIAARKAKNAKFAVVPDNEPEQNFVAETPENGGEE